MFNIGTGEMIVIAVVALLVLGPQRLPELARGIGKFIREFRRQTDDVRNVVEREFYRMDQEVMNPVNQSLQLPTVQAPPDAVAQGTAPSEPSTPPPEQGELALQPPAAEPPPVGEGEPRPQPHAGPDDTPAATKAG